VGTEASLQQDPSWQEEEVSWRRFNATATAVWLVMIPVAVVTHWVESVVFVSAISLYANVASHLAAWRADVPTEEEDDVQ
jgi:hypothetical protein